MVTAPLDTERGGRSGQANLNHSASQPATTIPSQVLDELVAPHRLLAKEETKLYHKAKNGPFRSGTNAGAARKTQNNGPLTAAQKLIAHSDVGRSGQITGSGNNRETQRRVEVIAAGANAKKQPNALTANSSYPTAHLTDTIDVNDVPVELLHKYPLACLPQTHRSVQIWFTKYKDRLMTSTSSYERASDRYKYIVQLCEEAIKATEVRRMSSEEIYNKFQPLVEKLGAYPHSHGEALKEVLEKIGQSKDGLRNVRGYEAVGLKEGTVRTNRMVQADGSPAKPTARFIASLQKDDEFDFRASIGRDPDSSPVKASSSRKAQPHGNPDLPAEPHPPDLGRGHSDKSWLLGSKTIAYSPAVDPTSYELSSDVEEGSPQRTGRRSNTEPLPPQSRLNVTSRSRIDGVLWETSPKNQQVSRNRLNANQTMTDAEYALWLQKTQRYYLRQDIKETVQPEGMVRTIDVVPNTPTKLSRGRTKFVPDVQGGGDDEYDEERIDVPSNVTERMRKAHPCVESEHEDEDDEKKEITLQRKVHACVRSEDKNGPDEEEDDTSPKYKEPSSDTINLSKGCASPNEDLFLCPTSIPHRQTTPLPTEENAESKRNASRSPEEKPRPKRQSTFTSTLVSHLGKAINTPGDPSAQESPQLEAPPLKGKRF